MTTARAHFHGMKLVVKAAGQIAEGRGILWSLHQHGGVAAATAYDAVGGGGYLLATFKIDPATGRLRDSSLVFPEGCPFKLGVWINNGANCTAVVTLLKDES